MKIRYVQYDRLFRGTYVSWAHFGLPWVFYIWQLDYIPGIRVRVFGHVFSIKRK